jgi:hypothetical protein
MAAWSRAKQLKLAEKPDSCDWEEDTFSVPSAMLTQSLPESLLAQSNHGSPCCAQLSWSKVNAYRVGATGAATAQGM